MWPPIRWYWDSGSFARPTEGLTQARAFGVFTGRGYGSFEGKAAESHPIGVLTQPRAFGAMMGRRYGSFAGRSEAASPHPVGRLTQLRAFGATSGRRYGAFSGRAETEPEEGQSGGAGASAPQRVPRAAVRPRREEEEILIIIAAALQILESQ